MPKLNLLPQRMPQRLSDGIGRTVGGVGITPNMISVAGLLGNLLAAWLITREELLAAGLVFLAFSALDMVDGAVARAMGTASPFGAVFDSVLDRAGEAAVLASCAWYFADRGEHVQVVVTFAALLGSISVSYMRARAEIVGVAMREGLFRRQERVVLLSLGLCLDGLTVVIVVLAVLANLTALQRLWLLTRALREKDREQPLAEG